MESFYDRLRSDYERTHDPLRDSPIGLSAISSRERMNRYRIDTRTSLHGVESALRHLPTHHAILPDQTTLFSNNNTYQLPENLVMGVYDPNASFETNLGYAEIVLGFIMSKGSSGSRFGGGGAVALANVAVSYVGYAFLVDGLQRVGKAAIADSSRRPGNVLYSRRSSSGNVDFDKLAEAGKANDRGGLTKAGRGLAKHGGRKGSCFPKPTGNPSNINKQGQELLEKILRDPNKKVKSKFFERHDEVVDIKVPELGGVRYTRDGKFIGFLQPK